MEPMAPFTLVISPTFPLDAVIRRVTIDGRETDYTLDRVGDRLVVSAEIETTSWKSEFVYEFDPGTDVIVSAEPAAPGGRSRSIRILRSRAESDGLVLVVEGLGQQQYELMIRSPNRLSGAEGVAVRRIDDEYTLAIVSFVGPENVYIRRELKLAFE